jgi:hypothetical protein
MNIRDNTEVCGYCGEKIAQHTGKATTAEGPKFSGAAMAQPGSKTNKSSADEPETEEEEGGGLSAILQSGEQVLIGSLNISVKKFFFHAYLTNKRIFLVDTQEKKLKVTAKDIARDTIVGSIVEFSENSDPVLVLSIKSADDEIKTMKLVFAQNGMDRSAEIDEWIALIHEEKHLKKASKPEEEPPRKEEEPEFVRPERPAAKQELHPARKPSKDHEKQPPVKRLLSLYKVPEEEREEERPPEPVRRAQIRQVSEPVTQPELNIEYDRESSARESNFQRVKKPEVQSAMKVAMKSAMHTVRQPIATPVRRPVSEPIRRQVIEQESGEERTPAHRPVVMEKTREAPRVLAQDRTYQRAHEPVAEKSEPEEAAGTPQFCHHCGKKLPHAANFCPGCGTKLSPQRQQQSTLANRTIPHEKPVYEKTPHEKKIISQENDEDDEDLEGERPVPAKPAVKKAPKGSEMTILHKFLRR